MQQPKGNMVPETALIEDAIRVVEASDVKVALVVDSSGRLIGTVTDGDIRRGMLRGVTSKAVVSEIMNKNPRTMAADATPEELLAAMRRERVTCMPIVDGQGSIVDIESLYRLEDRREYDNCVVIMAGGLGRRLSPLTDECPKPMLQVGGQPILETIIRQCVYQGFREFFVSINYKAATVREYFGDGEKLGATIRYIEEEQPLGTAGALALLPIKPDRPFLVINGDILTNINFHHMVTYHDEHTAAATVAVREYDVQIPYGIVKVENNVIREIQEKPVRTFLINAGIYVLSPEMLDLIPNDHAFDMPDLLSEAYARDMMVLAFPLREYWLDIGHMDDYVRANEDYPEIL